MNIKELTRKNRSYRRFDETKPISRETLLELVDTARFAPSSVNLQPLKFVLSADPETNGKIFPHLRWAKALPDFPPPPEGKRPSAYIILCPDKNVPSSSENIQTDLGITAQTITLAAMEKGIGGCLIGNYSRPDMIKAISLPEHLTPALVIALGSPGEEVLLDELEAGGKTSYYRDENYVHHVPKRKLADIVIDL